MSKETEERFCRDMIDSCFIYGGDILKDKNYNSCSEYYGRPYADKYIDNLGLERFMEIYNERKEYHKNTIILEGTYTDGEGVSYNSTINFKEDIWNRIINSTMWESGSEVDIDKLKDEDKGLYEVVLKRVKQKRYTKDYEVIKETFKILKELGVMI